MKYFLTSLILLSFNHLAMAQGTERIECESGRGRNKIELTVDIVQQEITYKSRYNHEVIPNLKAREDESNRILYALREEEGNSILLQLYFKKDAAIKPGMQFKDVYMMISRYITIDGARITAMVEDFECEAF